MAEFNFLIKYALIFGFFFTQNSTCLGEVIKTDSSLSEAPHCRAGGGGHLRSINNFAKCYDCSEKIEFSEEKFKNQAPTDFFSPDEIEDYVKNFLPIDKNSNPPYDREKTFCFTFDNGQFLRVDKGGAYWWKPLYEDEQVKTEKEYKYDGEKDYVRYYKNGQLKEKREPSKNGKEFYYESYYNNGQIRSKEWYIVVRKPASFCLISVDEKGNEIKDCTIPVEELIGLEEYYRNGQMRIKVKKGEKGFYRRHSIFADYVSVPYEMYDKNGKLKEKRFEDGTTEKYWENGNIKERCPHAEGGVVGEQCCEEYEENGSEDENSDKIRMKRCRSWIV